MGRISSERKRRYLKEEQYAGNGARALTAAGHDNAQAEHSPPKYRQRPNPPQVLRANLVADAGAPVQRLREAGQAAPAQNA